MVKRKSIFILLVESLFLVTLIFNSGFSIVWADVNGVTFSEYLDGMKSKAPAGTGFIEANGKFFGFKLYSGGRAKPLNNHSEEIRVWFSNEIGKSVKIKDSNYWEIPEDISISSNSVGFNVWGYESTTAWEKDSGNIRVENKKEPVNAAGDYEIKTQTITNDLNLILTLKLLDKKGKEKEDVVLTIYIEEDEVEYQAPLSEIKNGDSVTKVSKADYDAAVVKTRKLNKPIQDRNKHRKKLRDDLFAFLDEYKLWCRQGMLMGSFDRTFVVYDAHSEKHTNVGNVKNNVDSSSFTGIMAFDTAKNKKYESEKKLFYLIKDVTEFALTPKFVKNVLVGDINDVMALKSKADSNDYSELASVLDNYARHGVRVGAVGDTIIIKVNDKFKEFVGGRGGDHSDGGEPDFDRDRYKHFKYDNNTFKINYGAQTYTPIPMLNYMFEVCVPEYFKSDGGTLKLESVKGLGSLYVNLDDMKFYERLAGAERYKELGDITSFGDVKGENLSVYHKMLANGKKEGIIMLLKYKEGVKDKEDLYLTGRTVVFKDQYANSTTLNDRSPHMVVDAPETGPMTFLPRDFFFAGEGGNSGKYQLKYVNLMDGKKADGSSWDTDFYKGFVILRNNAYLKDEALLRWLESGSAEKFVGSKIAILIEKIKGIFKIDDSNISYEQYKDMLTLEQELAKNKTSKISFSVVYFVTMLIGYLIMLLIPLYAGVYLLGFAMSERTSAHRLFYLVSFKRKRIKGVADYEYSSKVKPVGWIGLVFTCGLFALVGVSFIMGEKVFSILEWVFRGIGSWFGV